MSSDPLHVLPALGRLQPVMRRYGPWAAWAIAAAIALVMYLGHVGLGSAPAAVEAREVSLAAPVTARVLDVSVLPGQHVSADQVVARLDPAEAEARVALAKAELQSAEAKVLARQAELALRFDDRRTLEAGRAALAVAELEAEEKRDRSQLHELDEQIAREAALVQSRVAQSAALDKLKLNRAVLAQASASFPATLRKAREHLATAERQRGGTAKLGDVLLAPAHAEVARAKAALALAESRRQLLDIKAPFDGRVGAVLLAPGATAREGSPVLMVVDERPTMAVAWIDQSWANEVQVGDLVSLMPIDRSGPSRTGRVVTVGPSIVETPKRFQPVPGRLAWSREAHVQVDTDAGQLVPGQAFRADFRRGAPPVGSKVATSR